MQKHPWELKILELNWKEDKTALQVRCELVSVIGTWNIPSTRQIAYFLSKESNGFRKMGTYRGVGLYRRVKNEISKNSMGRGL